VDDIHAEHARLTAAGVEFLMPPTHVSSDDTHDLYAAAFRDPDGHLLSITSRVVKQ
jgi:catechol 2,3-dioxygenase-like lactoylglutathione lyase family enzyme